MIDAGYLDFDVRYTDALSGPTCLNRWYEVPERPDIFRHYDDVDPCFYCGKPTKWVEINYQAPFCSAACIGAFEAEIPGGPDA